MKKIVVKRNKVKHSTSNTKSVELVLNPKIYPLEAIYAASYAFIDKLYIFLDGDPNSKIKIKLTPKTANSSLNQNSNSLKEEFLNELVNHTLRYQISKENKNLREFILGTALLGSLGQLNPSEKFFTDTKSVREELEKEEMTGKELIEEPEEKETFEDPLGIAVPWEEKFKPHKKRVKSAKRVLKKSKKSKK